MAKKKSKIEIDASNMFKLATDRVMQLIELNGFNILDIEYPGGYFIFKADTYNSVIHFHIKECLDWKFAIWWSYCNTTEDKKREKEYGTKHIIGEFFCQYEPAIDKFKPSHSSFNFNINVYIDADNKFNDPYIYDILRSLKYINKFPKMAWGIDYCGYDYNRDYKSRLYVTFKYYKYKIWNFNKIHIGNFLDTSFANYTLKLFKRTLTEDENNWEIGLHDGGENWSPRFDIVVKIPDDSIQETGCFGMFDDVENGKELQKKWDKRKDLYEKISNIFHFLWFSSCHDCVVFWKDCEQNKEAD